MIDTEQINQTIDEILGRCRHEWKNIDGLLICKCGTPYSPPKPEIGRKSNSPKDYTSDWSAYGSALKEMKGMGWWDKFTMFVREEGIIDDLITPSTGFRLIAEWYTQNEKEKEDEGN